MRVILLISIFIASFSYANDSSDLNQQVNIMEEQIDKQAKSQCYTALPSEKLCQCINSKLGWGVSFRDYVIIRTLETDKQKSQYIQQTFSQGTTLEKDRVQLIHQQVNDAWVQCRQ